MVETKTNLHVFRRRVFAGAAAASAAALLVGCEDSERYDSRLRGAVTKGKELAKLLTVEFSEAANLGKRLSDYTLAHQLIIADNPLSPGAYQRLIPDGSVYAKVAGEIYLHPRMFNSPYSLEDQVMILIRQTQSFEDQKGIVSQFIGKPRTQEVLAQIQQANTEGAFQSNAQILFRTCQQLTALQRSDPRFHSFLLSNYSKSFPWDTNESLISLYLKIGANPQKANHPTWQAAMRRVQQDPSTRSLV